MSNYFTDRESLYPNRYKVTPESGSAYYATFERADEPTEVGTAMNAAVLNDLITNMANLHVWKEYSDDPDSGNAYGISDILETPYTLVKSSSSVSPTIHFTGTYADSFTVADGAVSLVDPISIPTVYAERDKVIKGKYIRAKCKDDDTAYVYYVPTGSEYSSLSGTTTYATSKVGTWVKAYRLVSGEKLGYVSDFDKGAYPSSGEQDGKWYVYHKRLGD